MSKTPPIKWYDYLLPISLLFVAIAKIVQLSGHFRVFAMILFGIGSIGLALTFLGQSKSSLDDKRLRRLNRLGFIGSLFYIVSTGLMYDGQRISTLVFIIGTVFVAYSLLVRK